MPEILKLLELAQANRVAQMDVRRGRVDPQLDAQGLAARQLLGEFLLAVNGDCAAFEDIELYGNGEHGNRRRDSVSRGMSGQMGKKVLAARAYSGSPPTDRFDLMAENTFPARRYAFSGQVTA